MSQRYHSTDGRVILFAELLIPDSDDPEIYAAVPILDWEKTDEGNWIMNHALEEPQWRVINDYTTNQYKAQIYGKLSEADEIIYRLKFGHLR